jgi:hypothetical protein
MSYGNDAQDRRWRDYSAAGCTQGHAKAREVHGGRPPALNDYQREEAARAWLTGRVHGRLPGCSGRAMSPWRS